MSASVELPAHLKDDDDYYYAAMGYGNITTIKPNSHDKTKRASQEGPSGLGGDLIHVGGEDFCNSYTIPDYCIEGLLQRSSLYSLTGHPSSGKTAISSMLAVCKSSGSPFAGRKTEPGRVLYMAGENPDDTRGRIIACVQHLGLRPSDLGLLHVVPQSFLLKARLSELSELSEKLGNIDLVIVDTNAAYFGYENENDNVDARAQASDLRYLTYLAGKPCVVANCHPTKGATLDNLVPRGGGAFLGEIDSNLTCWKEGDTATLHHHDKHRGEPFDPIEFALSEHILDGYARKNGSPIRSIIANYIDEGKAASSARERRDDEDHVLLALSISPLTSLGDVARACGWTHKGARQLADRCLHQLAKDKLVSKPRNIWTITAAGKQELR